MTAPVSAGIEDLRSDAESNAIWRQGHTPVIYRREGNAPLLVKLPFGPRNGSWLREDHRTRPQWDRILNCWEVPRSWLDEIVYRVVMEFGSAYLIQPYRKMEKCAPACWTAVGFKCECSCMGQNHGAGISMNKWYVVSEACAIRWHGRELACRLIKRSNYA